jgi:drug/metabolite transporter (DMT)-like permease
VTIQVALLILLAAVMHASWNALLRGGRDRLWSGTIMSFSAAVASLFAVFFLPLPAIACWPYLFISAVVHIVYNLLLIRMYREGDFGVTYPVARGSSPLLIALGGAVFSAEFLTPVNVLGIALVCAGIFVLAWGGHHLHRKSIPAALATGCSIAIYSVSDGLGVRKCGNAASYTAWLMLSYGAVMPLAFMILRRGKGGELIRERTGKEFVQAIGGGLISMIAYGIVIWAMKYAALGVVSALRETSVLFAAVIGSLFLKEKFTARKGVAAALIGAGAACLHG